MKKIVCFLLAACIMSVSVPAFAKAGDVVGQIYTTDILTKVNGMDITSYATDGETLIALEDLADYGFTVTYDDSIRTLFVNQNGKVDPDFNPEIKRGNVGRIAGSIYETDITAYVNGTYIKTYAIDGKLTAKVETLGEASVYSNEYPYGMTYKWNNDERILTLDTAERGAKDELIAAYINPEDKFSWSYLTTYSGSYFDIVVCMQSGTTHGTYIHYSVFQNDGLQYSLNQVFTEYEFNDVWGRIRIEITDFKDDKLYFSGTKNDGRMGNYCLDVKSGVIMSTDDETPPDESRSSRIVPFKSPVGNEVVASGVNVEIDGVKVQGYYVNDNTYIDADTLLDFGFEKFRVNVPENVVNTLYFKKKDTVPEAVRAEPAGTYMGTVDRLDYTVHINALSITTLCMDDIQLINADVLCTPNVYVDYGMIGGWDSETNTLRIYTKSDALPSYEEQIDKVLGMYDDESHILYRGDDYSVILFKSAYSDDFTALFKVNSNGVITSLDSLIIICHSLFNIQDVKMGGDNKTLTFTCTDSEEKAEYRLDLESFEIIEKGM